MPLHHFISYSAVDGADFALRLADALTAGPPSHPVWLDKRHLEPGRDWDVQLADAIRDCEGLLFVLTRDSVEDASTCKAEWTRALKYKKPITPLLLHRDAELPFRMGSRQYIDFSGDFETGMAKLRRHLAWLRSPAGALQGLRDRLTDAQRDLRRADDADRPRIQDDIELLTRQIADQERIVADPDAAARRAEQSIAAGLERERQPERPIAGRARTKFINPPPGAAPSYFQDRAFENGIIAGFLRDEGCRLLTVVGRAGVGKTALVCRLLKALEAGHLPDDLGPLRPDGIVYLSATGTRRINVPNLYADLCKLLPDAPAAGLDAVYRNPQASTEARLAALLAEFPGRTPPDDDPPDDALPAAEVQPAAAFSTGHQAQVLRNLEEHFNNEELRSLCFVLGVDYDSLPALGKAGKARELIAYLDRTGRLHALVERGQQLRSHIPWGHANTDAAASGTPAGPDRPAPPPPATGTIVLLDNFEDLVDPATQGIHDAELDEALRALLNAGHHTVKVILTTRVAPRDLALIQPGRQCRLELDEGLPSPFAENILREMDRDGKVGLKTAPAGLLDRARVRTRGYPRALEALYGILSADRYTTLEEIVGARHSDHVASSSILLASEGMPDATADLPGNASPLPENVVAALVGEAFNRLDPTGQRVMQALAVYARPVTPAAVDFLLQPALPGLDSTPVLGRLVNMHFARREAGKFYLHPVDRAYAFERIGSEPAWGDETALLRRAADYFKQASKPRADWKGLDDLAPQLAEFDLRCAAGEYDTAARVLIEIEGDYLQLWGHYRPMTELHERLQGKLTDPWLKANSLNNLGYCYHSMGQIQKAVACHERALALAREVKDRQGEGAFLGNLGLCYADLGQTTRAIEYHEQALTIAREIGDQRTERYQLGNQGVCYAALGQVARAIEYHEQALAIAHKIGDRRRGRCRGTHRRMLAFAREIEDRAGEGRDLGNLGVCYADLGQIARAIECHEQALTIAREIGDRCLEEIQLGNLGSCYADLGQTARAIEYHEQALVIACEIEDRTGEGRHLGNLGSCYADLGQTARAIEYHEQALVIAREIGDRSGEGAALGNLGLCYAGLGQTTRAIECYEQALDVHHEIGDRGGEGINLGNLADALIDAGHYVKAIQRAGESIKIGEEISSPVIGSYCHGFLALAHLCAGDLPAARAAAEAARRYAVPEYNHNALALLGVIALRQDDPPAAREAFAAAAIAADGILAQTPGYFAALDAKGLACCGLALCDVVETLHATSLHLDAAIAAYRAARAINRDAGIVGRVLRLLDALAAAHGQGAAILAPARAAAANRSSEAI